jgi:hypothetical protein
MKIGSKIWTLYEHAETGVIVKPRRDETPPSSDWFIVRYDDDGARLCVHRSMLAMGGR